MLVGSGNQHSSDALQQKMGERDAYASRIYAYESYKPSGIPWIEDVPDHWEVRRLRTVADMRVSNVDKYTREDEFPVRLCNYVDVYKNDHISQAMPFISATASWKEIERFRLQRDDVLITKDSEAWDDIGVPSLVVESADDLLSGYHLALLRPFEDILGSYLARALQSKAVDYQFHVRANGVTRYGLTHTGIQSVQIPLPPLPEQQAIVRYLDYMDRRIRHYVRAKRKLIALLEEERQAVISQAVTRGLDLNVRLKSSGVEWLGDVPAHWEVLQVGHFSKVGNGSTPLRGNTAYWSNGTHPWLNSSSVNQATITRADQFVTDLALHECHLPRVRSGSVLVGITGQGKTRGMSAVLSMDATINQHMAYITPTTARVSSNYLQMCLTAAYSELRAVSGASGSTKAALTCQDIKRFRVVLPPRDEQDRLLSEVSRELASLDAAIVRARRHIELVQEYRTRLIADVVTGKLDVREAAAQLAEEADDPDPLDDGFPLTDGTDDDNYDAEEEAAEKPTMESEVTI